MDEPPKHHGKRKKSGAKDYILYVIYLILFNWNPRKGKSGCLGQRMGRKGMTELAWGYLLSDENILYLLPTYWLLWLHNCIYFQKSSTYTI